MSGIAGIIHFDGQPVAPGQIEAMTAAMPYRGPDGINHWRKVNVALGQCMLRTTPESLEEAQPLTNEDESLVLVMDGRVDNWLELRRELLAKGAVLRTRADAELVLRSYEVWGADCLPHIDGDFAFVIWDAKRQRAFCARDRFGNRPLTYHWNDRTLVFASEMHAVLQMSWIQQIPNEQILVEYLAAEWYARDQTLWTGVLRLIAAHAATVSINGVKLCLYWAPDVDARLTCRSELEYVEHYRSLLRNVVSRMSRANHPLACEVSGGLDSSAIFAIAESLRKQNHLLAPGLEGYCLNFEHDLGADEVAYSRAVGRHLGRSIHEVKPATMPFPWFQANARIYRDLPPYPNHSMLRATEAAARANGSRVLLSGLGGDEWVGGGQRHYADALREGHFRELLMLLHSDFEQNGLRSSLWDLFRFGVLPLAPARLQDLARELRAVVKRGGKSDSQQVWLALPMLETLKRARDANTALRPATVQRESQRRKLATLASASTLIHHEMRERQVAAGNLELRRPFWSRPIVEASFATPDYLLCRRSENKRMHRIAMRGLLPDSVLRRQTKAIFNCAFTPYLYPLRCALIKDISTRRQNWVATRELLAMMNHNINMPSDQWIDGSIWILWCVVCVDLAIDGFATTQGN